MDGIKEERRKAARNVFNVNYILLVLLLVCTQMFIHVLLFAVAMLAVKGV